jgi:hypothetical protein
MSTVNAITPERRARAAYPGAISRLAQKIDMDSRQRLRRFWNDAVVLGKKNEPDSRGSSPAMTAEMAEMAETSG